jgi:hypothetical protein
LKILKNSLKNEFNFSKPLFSTLCKDIQEGIYGRSFDLNNPEDYHLFLNAGGHSIQGCPKVCSIATVVTAKKLQELI